MDPNPKYNAGTDEQVAKGGGGGEGVVEGTTNVSEEKVTWVNSRLSRISSCEYTT